MLGYNVFFPIGFDDNGLPTERYVEKKYEIMKGDMRMSKQEFRKLCLKEVERIEEENIKPLFVELGFSCDWDLLYRTIDPWCQRVAQLSFIDLYKKGHVYRSNEPTLWCTHHQTALAQAEVEDLERETKLNYIYFDLDAEGDFYFNFNNEKVKNKILIATTRPELLCSCVGIFVHPYDERYKGLVGKNAIVPLFGHKVPIMADELVEREFGTGIVMICTFGDTADIEWYRKHKLPLRISVREDGTLNEVAGKYEGLSVKGAKEKIIDDLKEKKILINQESLTQVVGVCWRCETPVEFIVTEQWFIKILNIKNELIEQGRKINWYPEFYRVRYENWVENLNWDWCISRQRYYGIPIPVWYCRGCGKVILPKEEDLPVDPEIDSPAGKCSCSSSGFTPEEDVFDTWMTSSMTPEIACGWKEDDAKFRRIFPMSMRPQAHDIIRTWAFYTILKAYLHEDDVPWRDVMMSGHGLDSKGKKMSKSKGNVVLPHRMVGQYSADALRYWAASVTLGDDLPFQEKDIKTGHLMLNKLWNASRFVEMHSKDAPKEKQELRSVDRWILTRLSEVISQYHEHFRVYRITKAKKVVAQFFKHDFCDFYLELIKYRLYGDDEESKRAAQYTACTSLSGILKLFAPFAPFITEEIHHSLFKNEDESIHLCKFPEPIMKDAESVKLGELAKNIIYEIRKWKSDNGMALNAKLDVVRIYTENNIGAVVDDISGAMNISRLDVMAGKPEVEEKIVNVTPNFGLIGPEFGKDTNKAVLMIKDPKIADEIERKGIVKRDGFTLKREYIFKLEKEILSKGERVDIVENPEFTLEIEI